MTEWRIGQVVFACGIRGVFRCPNRYIAHHIGGLSAQPHTRAYAAASHFFTKSSMSAGLVISMWWVRRSFLA